MRTSRLARLASFSYRRRGLALVLWLVVLVGVSAASGAAGPAFHNDFSLPGTDSDRALRLLEERFPRQAGDTVQVVLRAPGGLERERDRVDALVQELSGLPSVAAVDAPAPREGTVSEDGRTGLATIALDGTATDVPADDVRRMIDVSEETAGDGLQVALGGEAVRAVQESGGGAAEGVGILAALVVLVLVFGSVVAAGLPIVTALVALGTTIGLIGLGTHVADVADFTPNVATLIGLGVGIDYALLIVSRYRTERAGGLEREAAVARALDTAGRTVLFAGGTVMIALLGLLALGLASLQTVAVASAVAVLVTMLTAVTLLPSLLGFAGPRIDRRLARSGAAAAAPGRRWLAWAAFVQRRRWPVACVATLALLALALPALDTRLGIADAGNDPAGSSTRVAYDLAAEGFGPGSNGPLLVVAQLARPGDRAAAERVRAAVADERGVASAAPARLSDDGTVATVLAVPATAPQDEATSDLVGRLREDVAPALRATTGADVLVGGQTAAQEDFAAAIADRLALFVAIVAGVSALLLAIVFRSVLLPVKAALLNLLSIGAALGVVTLVFQEGVLAGLVGVEPGPIEAFVPVMLFSIVFGLSMDYEVFLLSRVREEHERTGDPSAAVANGLAATGRIITAAAAIMVAVFGAFVLSDVRMLKMFGLGLAVAVLVDAVVIRCLLVPAVMEILGRASWWWPRRAPLPAPDRA